jgi:hypothetical protein
MNSKERRKIKRQALNPIEKRWREFEEEKANRPEVMLFGAGHAAEYAHVLWALLGDQTNIGPLSFLAQCSGESEEEVRIQIAVNHHRCHIQRVERGEDPIPEFPLVLIDIRGDFYTFTLYARNPHTPEFEALKLREPKRYVH